MTSAESMGMFNVPDTHRSKKKLKIGFIALTDAAPLIVAREQGIFERHGLDVTLSREVGWATIRDKVVFGELHAAHSLAGMLVATRLGIDTLPCDVTTGCVMSLHGNAVTLGRHLADSEVFDPAELREEVRRRTSSGRQRLVFGVVFNRSSHHVQLRQWLRKAGLNPDRDVQIVVVPPAQMVRNLTARTIDGFCVGEPWNSVAVSKGVGRIVSRSCETNTGHVEKVLMIREEFAKTRPHDHAALISAIVEAAAWSNQPKNRSVLAEMLSAPSYIGQNPEIIARALTGPFETGGPMPQTAEGMLIFSGGKTNHPSLRKAEDVVRGLQNTGLISIPEASVSQLAAKIFREDLFASATNTNSNTNATYEHALC